MWLYSGALRSPPEPVSSPDDDGDDDDGDDDDDNDSNEDGSDCIEWCFEEPRTSFQPGWDPSDRHPLIDPTAL